MALAARNGHLVIVRWLHGAQARVPRSVVGCAFCMFNPLPGIDAYGATGDLKLSLASRTEDGRAPAALAAWNGHVEILRFIHSSSTQRKTASCAGDPYGWLQAWAAAERRKEAKVLQWMTVQGLGAIKGATPTSSSAQMQSRGQPRRVS